MIVSKRKITVAEGVGNANQAEFLREHGCAKAQGFLFGYPMPAEEVKKALHSPTAVAQ